MLLLGAFAAPGAALAHGLAHQHEAEHRAEHVVAVGPEAGPALEAADHHDGHPHVNMDPGPRGRVDASAVLRPDAVSIPPARELEARTSADRPHGALPRGDPATGPPPRLRAPPAV